MLGVAARRICVQSQTAPVGKRLEVRPEGEHAQAVARQLELGDDASRHEAGHVGVGVYLEVGVLGPGRAAVGAAADPVAALEDDGAQAGAGEQSGADEPVVTAADDDRVVGVGRITHARILPCRRGARVGEQRGDERDSARGGGCRSGRGDGA